VPRVPVHQRWLQRRLEGCLDGFIPRISVRVRSDERGQYVSGFEGNALRNRIAEKSEPGSPHWLEAEAAKITYHVLIEDWKGERSIVSAVEGDWGFEDEIFRRAKARVPFWINDLAST
jgi:hypothetical protein